MISPSLSFLKLVNFRANRSNITADSLSADTKLVLEEVTRSLNLEKLRPSYKLVVTISCLKAIRTLQKFCHLPNNPAVFRSYAAYGNFIGELARFSNNFAIQIQQF